MSKHWNKMKDGILDIAIEMFLVKNFKIKPATFRDHLRDCFGWLTC